MNPCYRSCASFETATDGPFFESYLLITGYDFAHVVFIAGLLLLLAARPHPSSIRKVATVWHVTDLVWLAIFPILYLG